MRVVRRFNNVQLVDGSPDRRVIARADHVEALDGRLDARVAVAAILQGGILEGRGRLRPAQRTYRRGSVADILEGISKEEEGSVWIRYEGVNGSKGSKRTFPIVSCNCWLDTKHKGVSGWAG